ncbi:MAG TPA: molybdate ABC transporter substrate-binding protein, partial [Terriglobia bacterium]|nr:molybdate ABC transporter substrate-binding protein [Terriglobia bacterium]
RPYAEVPLVMVVPEALVDAPTSFESLTQNNTLRIAVGDPALTMLGQRTMQLLTTLGVWEAVQHRLDRASDVRSVLDHVLNGGADVGIVSGPDAVHESQRIRVVAVSERGIIPPVIHSMAMERYCPNPALCKEFLSFIQSDEAQRELQRLGYTSPRQSQPTRKE